MYTCLLRATLKGNKLGALERGLDVLERLW
jgi:hypothetical protein